MALKWPSVCRCAVKKLLTHVSKIMIDGMNLIAAAPLWVGDAVQSR